MVRLHPDGGPGSHSWDRDVTGALIPRFLTTQLESSCKYYAHTILKRAHIQWALQTRVPINPGHGDEIKITVRISLESCVADV